MKKIKIISLILSIIALVLAGFAFKGYLVAPEDERYTTFLPFKAFSVLFIIFILVLIVVNLVRREKFSLIPLLAIITTGIYFSKKVNVVLGNNDLSIIDLVSPADSTSVLTFIVFVAFVIFAFVALFKNKNWARFVVIGYISYLILTTFKLIPVIYDNSPYQILLYTMILSYLSLLTYFLPTKEKEIKSEDKVIEDKEVQENQEEK